jgi:hypothetical protein
MTKPEPEAAAAIAALASAIPCSAGAWLSWLTVRNDPHSLVPMLIGGIAALAGIGFVFVTASHGKLTTVVYRPLGSTVAITGIGMVGGVLIAPFLPRFNYVAVWGATVAIVGVLAALADMIANLSRYVSRNPSATTLDKIGWRNTEFMRECLRIFTIYTFAIALVLLIVGFAA